MTQANAPDAPPDAITPAQPPAPVSAPAVGHRAVSGFAWSLVLHVVLLAVQALTQFTLAFILTPAHFKLVALVFTVTAFTTLLQHAGIRTVLVQRYRDFDRLVTPAFWLSGLVGLLAFGITAALAPWAADFYDEPELAKLLILAAVQLPLISLCSVPDARLAAEMRFRNLTVIGAVVIVVNFAVAVSLAALGFGASSVILAMIASSAVRLAALWTTCPVPIRLRPGFNHWPLLISTGATVLFSLIAMVVSYQGHFVVLGRMARESDILGAFSLAYSLSDQATRALMLNLSTALFPALNTLHNEPRRQAEGFLKAVRGLMLIGFPLCFLQAVTGAPIFRLILPDRWHPGIAPFVIFSVAMLGRLVLGTCESMLMAQQRQKTWLMISVCYAAGFILATVAGTWIGLHYGDSISSALGIIFGAAEGCALGVALSLNIVTPIAMKVCITRGGGGTWADVWRDYRFPLLASTFSAALAWAAMLPLPASTIGDIARLVIAPLVMGGAYFLLVRAFARREAYDILGRLQKLLPPRVRAWLQRHAALRGMILPEPAGASAVLPEDPTPGALL